MDNLTKQIVKDAIINKVNSKCTSSLEAVRLVKVSCEVLSVGFGVEEEDVKEIGIYCVNYIAMNPVEKVQNELREMINKTIKELQAKEDYFNGGN